MSGEDLLEVIMPRCPRCGAELLVLRKKQVVKMLLVDDCYFYDGSVCEETGDDSEELETLDKWYECPECGEVITRSDEKADDILRRAFAAGLIEKARKAIKDQEAA